MTNVWCVRADGGRYAEHFVKGGYAAIGWREITQDLGSVKTREALYPIVKAAYPDIKSPVVIERFGVWSCIPTPRYGVVRSQQRIASGV